MTQLEILKLQQSNVSLNITVLKLRSEINEHVIDKLMTAGNMLQSAIEMQEKADQAAAEANVVDASKELQDAVNAGSVE
jgi:hypothetical protein